jgi:hypothetical protein
VHCVIDSKVETLNVASSQALVDETSRVREEMTREADENIAIIDSQLASTRTELSDSAAMVQTLQAGEISAKLTVSELQASIIQLEIERDDGLRERDLAVLAKTEEIEQESLKIENVVRESSEREATLVGQVERLGQDIVESETLRKETDEQIKLEIDARVKIEEMVKDLNDRLELEKTVCCDCLLVLGSG